MPRPHRAGPLRRERTLVRSAAASQAGTHRPALIIAHGVHRVGIWIPRSRVAQPARVAQVANGATATSPHWSGYVDIATRGRRLKSVSASFTIPSVNCAKSPDGSFASHWVGLDGWADSTIEHVGITAFCSGGTAGYLAFYEMSPLPPVAFAGFSPGDAVRASVTFKAPTWALTLKDITNGALVTAAQACPAGSTCRNLSAEVITEASKTAAGTILPLADYG